MARRSPSCGRRRPTRSRAWSRRVREHGRRHRAARRQYRHVRRRDAGRDRDGSRACRSARMNRIRALDASNATMTAEAGVPLAAVQQAAADAGLLFPLSLASEGSCTIGGNLSTNAGGTAVLRFGNARDLTLGLEVVLADGRIWNGLRGLRKDNTGYDLKQLFIGGEGTLGIVTAATLKLFPAPRTRVTALCALAVGRRGRRIAGAAEGGAGRSPDRIRTDERFRAVAVASSTIRRCPNPLPGHPWYALIQADDSAADAPLRGHGGSRACRSGSRRRRARCGGRAIGAIRPAKLWALRENISESQRREGPNIKHDISLPVSAIPALHGRMRRGARRAHFPGRAWSCSGTWATATCTTTCPRPKALPRRRSWRMARPRTGSSTIWSRACSGSFSAEHGVGQLKRAELHALQVRRRTRPDARGQGRARSRATS